jgi:hypothetical protein
MGANDALLQVQAGEMQALAGFAQAFAGVCGAAAVVWAANVAGKTFRSTLETKRAEAAFIVAHRAITFAAKASSVYSHIRNPISWVGEGSTRKKPISETEEQARAEDYAHLVAERINFHQEYWKTGLELRWEAEAVFGKVFSDAIEEILIQRNQIAVRWRIHVRSTSPNWTWTESRGEQLAEAESIVWEGLEEPDQFSVRLAAQQRVIIVGLRQFVSLENSELVQTPNFLGQRSWWERNPV